LTETEGRSGGEREGEEEDEKKRAKAKGHWGSP
jgi:hypothetical protein